MKKLEELGLMLRHWREERGITLYNMGKTSGLRVETIMRIEDGFDIKAGNLMSYVSACYRIDEDCDIMRKREMSFGENKAFPKCNGSCVYFAQGKYPYGRKNRFKNCPRYATSVVEKRIRLDSLQQELPFFNDDKITNGVCQALSEAKEIEDGLMPGISIDEVTFLGSISYNIYLSQRKSILQ